MKVTVSVHGRYHGFELAKGLYARHCLDQLLTTYPAFLARRWVGAGAPVKSAMALEIRRRLHARFGFGPRPDLQIARRFGEFARDHVSATSDIFVGWSSASLEAITPARAAGAKVIIERGSTHIAAQTEVLREAYRHFALPFAETDGEMIEREQQEYEQADRISVPSTHAARTFIDRGFASEKILVNGLGVDLGRFHAPPHRPTDRPPRILFVGGIGLRKGVPWLLEAFAPLAARAELHVVGPVSPDFQALLRCHPLASVHMRGAIVGSALAAEYGRADIFCLPSIEEGYGMVIAEAMACGLPIVTTHAVGAVDLLTPGLDGLVVPPADSPALALALEQLVDDAELRQKMGRRALETVRAGHSWEDYMERTLASYEKVLG
ncbi:MAG: glycosyltransferase family 4 protein [Rhodospirillales bacterium]|nr:glycosyltransferase family 4 protein [Rhodospirillales bacterium]